MEDQQSLLKDLKDISEPALVSIWPPAIGWWILSLLIVVAIFVLYYWWKKIRTPDYKKMALADFKNIQANFGVQNNARETTGEIALLIRKVMVARYGNQKIAGMLGDEWLMTLDSISQTQNFSEGAGKSIVTAHYAQQAEVDVPALFDATKKLLSRV